MKTNYIAVLLLFMNLGCAHNNKDNQPKSNQNIVTDKNLIIAHRGTTYWSPEETEPAYRWARNMGADYLELDIQLTKDTVLVAFHDNDLKRTTNVAELFPTRLNPKINDFTLKELRQLDAGSWFNTQNTERSKESYIGLKILTLKDVVKIAEGYRFKSVKGIPEKEFIEGEWTGNYLYEKDPKDNANRPGIYIETKHPKLEVERILAHELSNLGWNLNTTLKTIDTQKGKVGIANTDKRVILQSFSPESIIQLEKHLPNIPKCLLLWKPEMPGDLKENLHKVVQFSLNNKVQYIGPSIAGAPNNYEELTKEWMTDLIHNSGLQVHAYTFDTELQLTEYQDRVEAVFTNRADLALGFYKRATNKSAAEVLTDLGY